MKLIDIKIKTAEAFGVSVQRMLTKDRCGSVVLARQTAMYLARKHSTMTFSEIGEAFNRDHSTAMYAISAIENLLFVSKAFKATFAKIETDCLSEEYVFCNPRAYGWRKPSTDFVSNRRMSPCLTLTTK